MRPKCIETLMSCLDSWASSHYSLRKSWLECNGHFVMCNVPQLLSYIEELEDKIMEPFCNTEGNGEGPCLIP